ncbi:F-box domain-containing protein [Mycena venus]|uniref:F-box domain-containing protein n=1 Tax=Mycena venus TaxID=2733690 RepID=A0A8H6YTN3_9AGAR|nr:F-box domain-containing protein [Mycena venus]
MALPTGVCTLPVELLSRVFVLGAADQVVDSPFLLRPDEDHCVGSVTDFQLLVSHPAHIARAEAFLARAAVHYPLDILVDTVSVDDHIPGVTLCRDEMRAIFALIIPHVARWRAFHLKVRANECKLIARQALSTCGPAPRLETLQLYHFEDYRTTQNLYIATYRPPVVIFDNALPALKNVSLIGHPPALQGVGRDAAPLSPRLRRLRLHYSGPRAADEHSTRVCVPALEELSLTDLDPDHLARLLRTLELPRLATLALDLPEQDAAGAPAQDFTGVVQMIAGAAPPLPIAALHTLRITALECAPAALAALLRALVSLSVLELDFARVRDPETVCDVLLETIPLPPRLNNLETRAAACECECECEESRRAPVLPRLEEARLFGLAGERVRALMAFRGRFAEGCGCAAEGAESPPSSACSSCASSAPGSPGDSTAAMLPSDANIDANSAAFGCGRAAMPRFVVRWSPGRQGRGRDAVLEQLVRLGRVEWVDEDEGEDDDGNEDEESSEDEGEGEEDGGSDSEGPGGGFRRRGRERGGARSS